MVACRVVSSLDSYLVIVQLYYYLEAENAKTMYRDLSP
jgi:hypothetical protein